MALTASARQPSGTQRGCARTEKSCGPDARRLAARLAVMRRSRPGRQRKPRGDGGNSASLPEESAKDTVKPSAQGRPVVSAPPVVHPCAYPCTRDRGCQPAPGLPCVLFAEDATKRSQLGRKTPREYEAVSAN